MPLFSPPELCNKVVNNASVLAGRYRGASEGPAVPTVVTGVLGDRERETQKPLYTY